MKPLAADDRRLRGHCSRLRGASAETLVEQTYLAGAHTLAARRWRGTRGEIDLVFRQGNQVIFVEVKSAATHAAAARSLSQAQLHRILQTADEFLAGEEGGLLTDCRVDVALVDNLSRIEVLPNLMAA